LHGNEKKGKDGNASFSCEFDVGDVEVRREAGEADDREAGCQVVHYYVTTLNA